MTSININGRILDLSTPVVMGILNFTPDSFYDGGKITSIKRALNQVEKMINDGAKIIDVGGYSSRPGATEISENEEIKRVVPLIKEIKTEFPACVISVDTFRKNVAEKAVQNGANIINDISAGNLDKSMINFIADSKLPYIMMHMKGNPLNMQKLTTYNHLINEMIDYFSEKIELLLKNNVTDVIIDPGFGFAKTLDQNYVALKNLDILKVLQKPILVGLSRKSMIYNYLNIKPNDALPGTIALNMFSLQKGASILRVHDVKEANQTIKLYKKLNC